jgi:hypothetical protein
MANNGTYTWYPSHFFAWLEFFMGMMIGAWVPLMKRARNYDCFSAFWGVMVDWYA